MVAPAFASTFELLSYEPTECDVASPSEFASEVGFDFTFTFLCREVTSIVLPVMTAPAFNMTVVSSLNFATVLEVGLPPTAFTSESAVAVRSSALTVALI